MSRRELARQTSLPPKHINSILRADAAITPETAIKFERALGMSANYWLNKDKAIIQLSLRYRSGDHLWFTFFHEAGHILLHGKKEMFLEGANGAEPPEGSRSQRL